MNMQPVPAPEIGNKIDDDIDDPTAKQKKEGHETKDRKNRHTKQKKCMIILANQYSRKTDNE